MHDKSIELIINHLDKIANKLGVGVAQIWPWMVRQQYINAISSTVFLAIVSYVSFKFLRFVANHWHPSDSNVYSIYREDHEPVYIFAMIILALIFIFSFISFILNFPLIFNPEYGALRSLLSMAKGQ